MPLPLAAIAAIPAVIKGISGLAGVIKGNARAKRNIRPIENANALIAQNNAIAENDALVGMPQEQFNLANQGLQRNQAAGFRQLGRSANASAGLASLVRGGNDAVLNLGAQDAAMRMNNRRFAFGTRSALANEQNRVFDWNKRRKFQEEAAAAAEQIGAGRANAFGALTDLSQIGQSYLGGGAAKGTATGSNAGITNYLPNATLNDGYGGSQPSFNRYNKYSNHKFG